MTEAERSMDTKACAITGHRPNRFKWKYKENNNGCKRLKKRLRDQFMLLYAQGVRRFYVGGALGVDMWAGDILPPRSKRRPVKCIAVTSIPEESYRFRFCSENVRLE